MSDSDDLDLGDDSAAGGDSKGSSGKPSGGGGLLPNLLKFVAIGLGALIFIVTVAVITYNILNKGGKSQTVTPENAPYVGTRPEYNFYTIDPPIRTSTKDPVPYSVMVGIALGYDLNDKAVADELTSRLYELRDFIRSYFRGKSYVDLLPDNEARLKQEIVEQINTRILSRSKIRMIVFSQLDVVQM